MDILKQLLGSGSFVATILTGLILAFARGAGLSLDHDQVFGIVASLVAFLLVRLGKTALTQANQSVPSAVHATAVLGLVGSAPAGPLGPPAPLSPPVGD